MEILQPVHIMLDNETLSVLPNAHIAQAALVHFDPHTFQPLASKVLSIDTARQPGTVIEAGTVEFWMKQPKEIQQSVFYGEEERLSISVACCEFYRFVVDCWRRIAQEDDTPSLATLYQTVQIWAKPPRFDIPQWENAFRHTDVNPPWFRRNVNDVQSLLNDATRRGFNLSDVPHSLAAHQPLEDCLYQIHILKAITEFNRG